MGYLPIHYITQNRKFVFSSKKELKKAPASYKILSAKSRRCSLMVKRLLAMQIMGVRFPSLAPEKNNSDIHRCFLFIRT